MGSVFWSDEEPDQDLSGLGLGLGTAGGMLAQIKRLASVPGHSFKTEASRRRMHRFVAQFDCDQLVLNVGSGRTALGGRVINLDVTPFEHVHLLGDGLRLPIREASVDGLITVGVLEHVVAPQIAVAESRRVLKPGGMAYHEVPFIQGYHRSPRDFQRWTMEGISELFRDFEIVDRGVAVGPASATGWILTEFLATLFAFRSATLHKAGRRLFGWITAPVKYLDVITEQSPFASSAAAAFYVIVRKPRAV